jgi:hypothetical protein
VYNAYDFLALEDESLYTCKGIAGPPELLKKHAENVQATVIEVEGDSEGEGAFLSLLRCLSACALDCESLLTDLVVRYAQYVPARVTGGSEGESEYVFSSKDDWFLVPEFRIV